MERSLDVEDPSVPQDQLLEPQIVEKERLDDGIAVVGWGAVMGVDGEEQGAQHLAL